MNSNNTLFVIIVFHSICTFVCYVIRTHERDGSSLFLKLYQYTCLALRNPQANYLFNRVSTVIMGIEKKILRHKKGGARLENAEHLGKS